jgi:hypothetical protein
VHGEERAAWSQDLLEAPERCEHDRLGPVVEDLRGDDEIERPFGCFLG